MLATVTMAQSVSPEQVIAQVGAPVLILGVIIAAAISGLIVGLLLKFVGASVLGYPVKYGSSFLSIFVAVLVSSAISVALLLGGIVEMPVINPDAGLVEKLMPNGPIVFVVTQAISLLIMTWAIHTFLKGPSEEEPSWSNALMIALIMTVILIAFAVLLSQLGAGMQR